MIKSLQGLRVVAMLSIFMFHSGLLFKGTFPVTLFFILSGFVMYYRHSEDVSSIKGRENIVWGLNKIKRLYPIHLITFIISIIVRWSWVKKYTLINIIKKAVINICLLQSLSLKEAMTFNGASWFLSTISICYLITPLLCKSIRKVIKYIKVNQILVGVYFLQVLVFLTISIAISNYGSLFYTNPCFRIFDYLLGMLLAEKYLNKEKVYNQEKKYTRYELYIFCTFLLIYRSSFFIPEYIPNGIYYSPIFAIGIYILAMERGWFSKILGKAVFQRLATISFEFYMVHELVLIVFRRIFSNISCYWLIKNSIIAIPSLFVSLIGAYLLHKIVHLKIRRRTYFNV